MAHSLETRVPFLDNDLVDFAVRVPAAYKLRPADGITPMDENEPGKRLVYAPMNHGKLVLRKAMARVLPPETLTRTKQGFSAPDASWFRGESIDYINRLLGSPDARLYEFLERDYVREVLDQHCSGRVNRRLLIWSFLSFEWWCRRFLTGDPLPN
jgi:asparagine synthase (glutamine-hydrolysing)